MLAWWQFCPTCSSNPPKAQLIAKNEGFQGWFLEPDQLVSHNQFCTGCDSSGRDSPLGMNFRAAAFMQ